MFQFTHPGKGATTATSKTQELFNCVSIHAPWEGCDCTDALAIVHAINVSIHAPWEGCDVYLLRPIVKANGVSIHAPWEGCDSYRYTLYRSP